MQMSAGPSAAVVLYVEDEVLTQQLVEDGLNDAGFSVVVASNAEEGLAVLRTRGPDIVGLVTDIIIPERLARFSAPFSSSA